MLFLAIFLLALAAPSWQQKVLESPCPNIIQFEPLAPHNFTNRWNATITLPPGGIWNYLRINLDKKAHLLGTTHGEVTTTDNTEFMIDNPESTIPNSMNPRRPPIWIFVKYGNEPPPKVQAILIDGNKICEINNQNNVEPLIPERPLPQLDPYVEPPITPSPLPQRYPEPLPESPLPQLDPYVEPLPESPLPQLDPYVEPHNTRIPLPPHYSYVSTTSAPDTYEWNMDQTGWLPETYQECGKVKMEKPVPLVTSGMPTLEGQWPWQVAIYKQKNSSKIIYQCGGTLVSKRHVITAAHCTIDEKKYPFEVLDPALLLVRLGKHHLFNSRKGYQTADVRKVIVHPDHKRHSPYDRDLSILELCRPVEYTDRVQPACLWPDQMADVSYIVGRTGMVVGWGKDGAGNLLSVGMPVVNDSTCLRSKPPFYASLTPDYSYCAGSRNGSSPCNGDSGGGMVFQHKATWYLRGVVSFAASKPGETADCDPYNYVVFTDLAQFLPWIRENIPFDSY